MSWEQVKIGNSYTKKELAEILGETTLPPVREGVFSCRKSDGYILFVNLDKASAKPEHKFNDFLMATDLNGTPSHANIWIQKQLWM